MDAENHAGRDGCIVHAGRHPDVPPGCRRFQQERRTARITPYWSAADSLSTTSTGSHACSGSLKVHPDFAPRAHDRESRPILGPVQAVSRDIPRNVEIREHVRGASFQCRGPGPVRMTLPRRPPRRCQNLSPPRLQEPKRTACLGQPHQRWSPSSAAEGHRQHVPSSLLLVGMIHPHPNSATRARNPGSNSCAIRTCRIMTAGWMESAAHDAKGYVRAPQVGRACRGS